MNKPYILNNYSVEKLINEKKLVKELYDEYGVVILPKFLTQYPYFKQYVADLRTIMSKLVKRYSDEKIPQDLGEILVLIAKHSVLDGRIVADLGTQYNKFFSFNQIKYSEWVREILIGFFGKDSIIVSPQAGDTLHFFPPGESFHKYNLPAHQDYQYLMQSPKQVTLYFGLSKYKNGVGGLRIWERSHKLGILRSTKNQNGSFEVYDWEKTLKNFTVTDYFWNAGDFGLFDSLLAHSSMPNTTKDCARIVQIFRYSDLNNSISESYDYYSKVYERRGVDFTKIHSDLYVEKS